MDRFLALHTDDVRLTVANYPTAAGKDALAGRSAACGSASSDVAQHRERMVTA